MNELITTKEEYMNEVAYAYLDGVLVYNEASEFYKNISPQASDSREDDEVYAMSEYL
jgi:hypothetical protein